jgi:hypothetical protein
MSGTGIACASARRAPRVGVSGVRNPVDLALRLAAGRFDIAVSGI